MKRFFFFLALMPFAALGQQAPSGAVPAVWVSLLVGNPPIPDSWTHVDSTAEPVGFPNRIALDGKGNAYAADEGCHCIHRIVLATAALSTLEGSLSPDVSLWSKEYFKYIIGGVAADGLGNVYLTLPEQHSIRKIVVATGVVSTLAGSGAPGFADGTGAAAQFHSPDGLALDGSGNLYVADGGNHRIRSIELATGAVRTLAGSGKQGYTDGAGATACFDYPRAIASDGNGVVYVLEGNTNRIRQIRVATGEVATLASGRRGFADGLRGVARFSNPQGIAADGRGNVYVADYKNRRVRRIVAATGMVSTLAGSGKRGYADGPGLSAKFSDPIGLAVDTDGTVYVCESKNRCIRVIRQAAP